MKRNVPFVLFLILSSGLVYASGSREIADSAIAPLQRIDTTNPWSSFDTSKPVRVDLTVLGAEGVDQERVIDLVNERMKALINTTIEVTIIPLAEYATKYPLALAGGSDVDLIFCAFWLYFQEQADRGAFLELSPEFRETWMPETMKTQVPVSWNQALYKGKIYIVPRNYSDFENTYGVLIRKDIREKYGIGKIESLDGYIHYLKTVAANEKGSGLFALYSFPSLPIEPVVFRAAHGILNVESDVSWNSMEHEKLRAEDTFYIYTSNYYREYALLMAELAQLGVWPANAINGTIHTSDLFREGKSASNIAMYKDANSQILEMAKRGLEIEYCNILPEGASTRISPYYFDSIAITSFSRNPERAALALDVMKNDLQINRLLVGGIEGEHYLYDEKNNTHSEGPRASEYPWSGWAWALRSHLTPEVGGLTDDVARVRREFDEANINPSRFPIDGFTFDNGGLSAETTVIASIVRQYQFSFDLGVFSDDTPAKLNQFITELKKAGIDDVVDSIQRQLRDFIEGR